jgi:hypothetical protein
MCRSCNQITPQHGYQKSHDAQLGQTNWNHWDSNQLISQPHDIDSLRNSLQIPVLLHAGSLRSRLSKTKRKPFELQNRSKAGLKPERVNDLDDAKSVCTRDLENGGMAPC